MEEVHLQTKTRVVTQFSGRVRKDSHRRGKQVQVETVCAALGSFNVNIPLDTWIQPLHQPGSDDKYTRPLQQMLKGFKNKEQPRVKKLAMNPGLPDWICKCGHRKGILTQQQVVVDLEIIEFYYLLRVGEYTAPKR